MRKAAEVIIRGAVPPWFDRPAPEITGEDIRRHSIEGSYPDICFDDEHFLISRSAFDALPEYSRSKPSGVFDGKCWKCFVAGVWFVRCYIQEVPPHPDGLATISRRALIVEGE